MNHYISCQAVAGIEKYLPPVSEFDKTFQNGVGLALKLDNTESRTTICKRRAVRLWHWRWDGADDRLFKE